MEFEKETIIEESLAKKLEKLARAIKDEDHLKRAYDNNDSQTNHYINNKVNDRDYDIFKDLIKTMKSETSWSKYKKAFDTFCSKCNQSPNDIVIKNVSINKGEENKNKLQATFYKCKSIVVIPNDEQLVHHSSKNIDNLELKPVFHNDSGSILYSSPRIYFYLTKKIKQKPLNRVTAGKTINLYIPLESIKTCKIDPLIKKFNIGSVYIETKFPMKVKNINNIKTEMEKSVMLTKEQKEEMNIRIQNVYNESAESGLSIDERENAVSRIRYGYMIENFVNDENFDCYTPTEKFEKVKSVLYEKCNEGIMDIDTREKYIQEAHDYFFH